MGFGDGKAGGGLVGERGDEGLQGDVVDGAGQAAAGEVDQVHGVVGEQRIGPAGDRQVVLDVAGGLLLGHGQHPDRVQLVVIELEETDQQILSETGLDRVSPIGRSTKRLGKVLVGADPSERSGEDARTDGRVSGMEISIAPDSGDEEHVVIAHFRLASDGFGDVDQRERIYDAEQVMEAAAEEAGVGEVDGNEFGGGEAVVYAYGPDADALFKVMEPTLRRLPFRPAHVLLRRGDVETRVDL
ncbi:hypothetical protein ACWFRM_00930 [Streptomyces sp. NPDC055144]